MEFLKKLHDVLFEEKPASTIEPVAAPVPAQKQEMAPPIPKKDFSTSPFVRKEVPIPAPTPKKDPVTGTSALEKSASELLENTITKKEEPVLRRSPVQPTPTSPVSQTQEHTDRSVAIKRLLDDLDHIKERNWQEIPPFHINDGTTVASIHELADACQKMTQETFSHHVTDKRNDFATWVQDVFTDETLSARIRAAKTPKQLRKALLGEKELELPKLETKPVVREDTDAYQAEILALREELESLRHALSEEIRFGMQALEKQQHEHDEMKKEYLAQTRKKEEELRNREQKVKEQEQRLSLEMKEFMEEKEAAKHTLAKAASVREELEAKNRELAKAREAVSSHQQQIDSTRKQLEELDDAIATRRQGLAEHEKIVTKEGFSEFARERLADMSVHTPTQVRSTDAERLLGMVRETRNLLEKGSIDDARKTYTTLRETFYDADIHEEERHEIYNLIREVYTDIELASLH